MILEEIYGDIEKKVCWKMEYIFSILKRKDKLVRIGVENINAL